MKNFQIDAGNSRVKWRLVCDNKTIENGYILNEEGCLTRVLRELTKKLPLDFIFVSSVSHSLLMSVLKKFVKHNAGIKLYHISVIPDFYGINLAYEKTIGVDRWLALIASASIYERKNKIIIDYGTAITIDFLDQNNSHGGGYIMPGALTLQKSLMSYTEKLPYLSNLENEIVFGKNTESCIRNGTAYMIKCTIEGLFDLYDDAVFIFTGGDSEFVYGLVDPRYYSKIFLDKELIFKGMDLILKK